MKTDNKNNPLEKDRNTLSLELMNRMKLHGMAQAFRESLNSTYAETMTPTVSSRGYSPMNGITEQAWVSNA